jgi:hypothetical protein
MAQHASGSANQIIEDAKAAQGKWVTLGAIVEAIGYRSYGPIYVLTGLISLTPLGALPGSPTATGAVVLLIAVQQFLGHHARWLPNCVKTLSIQHDRYERALDRAQRLSQWFDKLTRERLTQLVTKPMQRLIAIVVMLLGLSFLPFELLPFGADIPAIALLLIGLGLTSNDGLFVILGTLWLPVAVTVIAILIQ